MMPTLFVFMALVSLWSPSPQSGSAFVPAKVTSAGGITFPANSTATGIVTLAVNLDAMGNQQNTDVLRDLPSMTGVALAATKAWVFAPATLDGQPVPSVVATSVVFNPFNPAGVGSQSLTIPLSPATPGGNSAYTSPQILAASFATFPVNSVSSGAVVLDVSIGSSGGVTKVHVVSGAKPFKTQALAALKNWKFGPATFQGNPVPSEVIIEFVFPSPGRGAF
jgi:TonB family protein